MGDQHPSWRLSCVLPLSVAALACGGAPAEPSDGGRDSSVVDASEPDAFVAIDAGPSGRPVPPASIVELNLGETWSAALLDDGDVWVWSGLGFLWPTVVPAFSDVTDIGFAGEPPCAIYDGGVHCLGSSVSDSTAIDLPRPAVQVTAGEFHACAILDDASLWCWGSNRTGQLGDGTTDDSADPVRVDLASPVTEVALADYHTCALTADGSVYCWGFNYFGQLGRGYASGDPEPTPVEVDLPAPASALALGVNSTVAVLDGAGAYAWGHRYSLDGLQLTPAAIVGLDAATAVAAGDSHLCAVDGAGRVHCMGDHLEGQLGVGEISTSCVDWDGECSAVPLVVELPSSATRVAAGAHHTCVELDTSEIWCWGAGRFNEITSERCGDLPWTEHACTRSPVHVFWPE